jgi:hypothetical protein
MQILKGRRGTGIIIFTASFKKETVKNLTVIRYSAHAHNAVKTASD